MRILEVLKRYIRSPRKIIRTLGKYEFLNFLSDETYLKLVYWAELKKKLNLNNPRTYNEKLQWLKIHDRNPNYTQYVDKYLVRNYIKDTIGEQYLIPLHKVYERVEDIDWGELPNEFVLKCTHGSGSNIICKNKNDLDIEKSKEKLAKWMKSNWYWLGREWPYLNIKPRIICEKYLTENITDYKFMCFNGVPKIIQVHRNRSSNHTLDFYDSNWKKTDIRRKKTTSKELIPKPKCFEEMLAIAKELSKEDIHVRIDLFEVDQKVYFSEKTYYSASGFSEFEKDQYDELLGSWIKINN